MDREPTTLGEPIQKVLDDTLRPFFGELLPEYYAEMDRHREAMAAISKQYISGWQVAFSRALERAIAYGPGPADEAGYEVVADMNDRKDGQDESEREARLAEIENNRRRVADIQRRAQSR